MVMSREDGVGHVLKWHPLFLGRRSAGTTWCCRSHAAPACCDLVQLEHVDHKLGHSRQGEDELVTDVQVICEEEFVKSSAESHPGSKGSGNDVDLHRPHLAAISISISSCLNGGGWLHLFTMVTHKRCRDVLDTIQKPSKFIKTKQSEPNKKKIHDEECTKNWKFDLHIIMQES